jgi:hypothetical protein
LKADGSIHRWGCNGPCPVPSPDTGFIAIATHFDHSLAVRAEGSIVAWGSNEHGQLDVPAPNTGFVSVAAGDHFSLGLKSDGTLWAWGGWFGQDDVPAPNRGYLAMSANRGLADLLKSDATDPIFSEAPPLARTQTFSAIVADIDADGDEDLVSADYAADAVSWYENNGGSPPMWTRRIVDGSILGPERVAAGDLDGDGDLDLFASAFNDEAVYWYENSGASPPRSGGSSRRSPPGGPCDGPRRRR